MRVLVGVKKCGRLLPKTIPHPLTERLSKDGPPVRGDPKENGRVEVLPLLVFTRSVENGTKYLLGGHFFLLAFYAHVLQLALLGGGKVEKRRSFAGRKRYPTL